MKKIILTGMRPTGPLHIGHLLGALNLWAKLQKKYECYFLIADYQVLSDHMDKHKEAPDYAREIVADWMAAGLDPKLSAFVLQSKIPQLSELTFYFSFLVTVSRARRNPTVKEEAQNVGLDSSRDDISLGFLGYPVSQAADILLFKADLIPVGEDQAPHIEQTREVARSFNRIFGKTFSEPKAMFAKTPRILGLDGRKMSKSLNNAIFLKDSPEEIREKIKKAKTDSFPNLKYDPEKRPEISNLMDIYAAFSNESVAKIENRFSGEGYSKFKSALGDLIIEKLESIRRKREDLNKKPAQLDKILIAGTKKAINVAEKTIKEVRLKVFPYEF